MTMTEAKRRAEVPISPLSHIAQKKRTVTALSQKPRVARAVKSLCQKHASSLFWPETVRGYSAVGFLISPWQKISETPLMLGFDTADEGHKTFALAVKTERSWEAGMSTC